MFYLYLFPEIEEEEEVGPYDLELMGQRQMSQTEEGEPGLKAWPPMSNTHGTAQNRGQCVSLSQDVTDNKILHFFFLNSWSQLLIVWIDILM